MQLHLASQMAQNRVNGENEIKAEVMDELDESEEKSISSKDDSEKGLYTWSQLGFNRKQKFKKLEINLFAVLLEFFAINNFEFGV